MDQMNNQVLSGLDIAENVNLLGPEAEFTVAEGGFLDLAYQGKTYHKVILSRLLPLTDPEDYVSVGTEEDGEIGILPNLSVLPPEQRELVEHVLKYKYFTPRILSVTGAKERISYLFLDVVTSAGQKRLCIADYTSNMRVIGEHSVSIIDAQGNRYFIDDVRTLDKKSFGRLDQYL